MNDVIDDKSVFIPPIVLAEFEEFRHFARQAAIVAYKPEYFHSPFLDDTKRLRRITLNAIGVRVKGVALTFKYVLDYNTLCDPSKTWDEQVAEVDDLMSSVVNCLREESTLVRGSLDTETALGETLVMRP
ncbi:MAG: hypothetical protein GF411_07550 [Candidatus Lokiarchaeota archaeon]|nr:hypothetical protein [Candidatus Lokiarchaeota archaeon]